MYATHKCGPQNLLCVAVTHLHNGVPSHFFAHSHVQSDQVAPQKPCRMHTER